MDSSMNTSVSPVSDIFVSSINNPVRFGAGIIDTVISSMNASVWYVYCKVCLQYDQFC